MLAFCDIELNSVLSCWTFGFLYCLICFAIVYLSITSTHSSKEKPPTYNNWFGTLKHIRKNYAVCTIPERLSICQMWPDTPFKIFAFGVFLFSCSVTLRRHNDPYLPITCLSINSMHYNTKKKQQQIDTSIYTFYHNSSYPQFSFPLFFRRGFYVSNCYFYAWYKIGLCYHFGYGSVLGFFCFHIMSLTADHHFRRHHHSD